jgi:hypothetical protein
VFGPPSEGSLGANRRSTNTDPFGPDAHQGLLLNTVLIFRGGQSGLVAMWNSGNQLGRLLVRLRLRQRKDKTPGTSTIDKCHCYAQLQSRSSQHRSRRSATVSNWM